MHKQPWFIPNAVIWFSSFGNVSFELQFCVLDALNHSYKIYFKKKHLLGYLTVLSAVTE